MVRAGRGPRIRNGDDLQGVAPVVRSPEDDQPEDTVTGLLLSQEN
jgi:hypothetical protein